MNRLKQYRNIVLIGATAVCAGGLLSAGLAFAEPMGLEASMANSGVDIGAQKVPLTRTNRDCNGNIVGTSITQRHGFVVFNPTGSGKLLANIVLKDATPNATYRIRLIQTNEQGLEIPGQCADYEERTLRTDADGDGSVNFHEMLLPMAEDAFVVLNNQANGEDFFTTAKVFF